MSFIFVGGCQRTGTSLMQALLCSDPAVNPYVAEAEYLRQMIQPYHEGKGQFDYSLVQYFGDRESFRRFHGDWIRAFLSQLLARFAPAAHLVLKEPHLTFYFPDLWELIPEARFVVMMRDPRDTLLSMMEVGGRLAERGSRHFLAGAGLKGLIEQYWWFYRGIFECRDENFRSRLLILRYEDLVAAPADVIARVRDFTGLTLAEVDPSVPWKRSERHLENPHQRQTPWRTELWGREVSAARVGRFREHLDPGDVRTIDAAFGKLYAQFGYAPAGSAS